MRVMMTLLLCGLIPVTAGAQGLTAQWPHEGLTPMGAESGASPDGRIPAWAGGLEQGLPVDPVEGYQDPWPEDQLLYEVTADNLESHSEFLTPAQLAMLERRPRHFRLPVYPTRRSAGFAPEVEAAVARNYSRARLVGPNTLREADTGPAFPVPENGLQVIWNHKTRYRGSGLVRYANIAIGNVLPGFLDQGEAGGSHYGIGRVREEAVYPYSNGAGLQTNRLRLELRTVLSGTARNGTLMLIHQSIDPSGDAGGIWVYSPGERRVRRMPVMGYDNTTLTEGLSLRDQQDMFSGPVGGHAWTLLGKREIYAPYNAYRLESKRLTPDDVMGRYTLNPEHLRYERRRVWVVEARPRDGSAHPLGRRTFYLDEDSWHILLVDVYDRDDRLIQLQEAHVVHAPDARVTLPTVQVLYDLRRRPYVVHGLDNNELVLRFDTPIRAARLTPAVLRQQGRR